MFLCSSKTKFHQIVKTQSILCDFTHKCMFTFLLCLLLIAVQFVLG
ncbi:hypothetical protein F0Z19_0346 [Vibrio cyclitrophicus]|nr:hypothetical protein M565_ctg5P1368 [Vibrio cyclitrophicus FF75]KAA8602813.1 hypothetical protein F0Z19_0346 [Vibrio cyclitrophicus]